MAEVVETRRIHREKISLDAAVTHVGTRKCGRHDYQPTRLRVDYSRDGSGETGISVRILGPYVDSTGKQSRQTAVEDVFVLEEAPDWVRSFVDANHPWKDSK